MRGRVPGRENDKSMESFVELQIVGMDRVRSYKAEYKLLG